MANYLFNLFSCVHFLRGGGMRKCTFCTKLNGDNFGQAFTYKYGNVLNITLLADFSSALPAHII